MDLYREALEALYILLDKSGVKFWRDWISQDIKLWEENKSVEHHFSAYGGMGSLNDVVICTENNHNVTKIQEPWVNWLFDCLKSLCWYTAKSNNNKVSIDDIKQNLGHGSTTIQGWRCLKCGYSELTTTDIDNYIASYIVKDDIVSFIQQENLKAVVEHIWLMDSPRIEQERLYIRKIAEGSNISISSRVGWLRPCPSCKEDDTVVYRWRLVTKNRLFQGNVMSFEAANDNLPLRVNK